MILLQSPSRFVLQTLENRVLNSPEKGIDLDCQSVEFDDVRYHIQFSMKRPQVVLMSVSLPTPPPETVFVGSLPVGALEAVKMVYGSLVQIFDPPKDGYNLTMKLILSKLPADEGSFIIATASVKRELWIMWMIKGGAHVDYSYIPVLEEWGSRHILGLLSDGGDLRLSGMQLQSTIGCSS